MERLVSRQDLQSPVSSVRSSPDYEAVSKLLDSKQEFDFIENSPKRGTTIESSHKVPSKRTSAEVDDHDEGALEFRLFASAPGARTTVQSVIPKIRLQSPVPTDPAKAGFVVAQRPSTYYFADTTPSVREQYEQVAVSGHQIQDLARVPWPGDAYPWRVLHLPSSRQTRHARVASQIHFARLGVADEDGRRRGRLGKKARIKLRTKIQVAQQKVEMQKAAEKLKEANDREKRTARNREKKIKRRERERAKKAVGQTGEQSPGGSDDDGSAT